MPTALAVADPLDPRIALAPVAACVYIGQGRSTPVDEDDYPYLIRWVWSAHRDQRGNLYVARLEGGWPRPRRRVFLHREVMLRVGPPPSDEHRYVDHKNGDALDNRRQNLRWATAEMNARNTWLHRLAHGVPA